MIYYKTPSGEVFAYETQEHREKFGAADLVPMTDAEVQAHLNPVPVIDLQEQARAYLASTDWYIIRRADTGRAVPEDVVANRAAARELL